MVFTVNNQAEKFIYQLDYKNIRLEDSNYQADYFFSNCVNLIYKHYYRLNIWSPYHF